MLVLVGGNTSESSGKGGAGGGLVGWGSVDQAFLLLLLFCRVAFALFCGFRSCTGRLLMLVVAGFALVLLLRGLLLSFGFLH